MAQGRLKVSGEGPSTKYFAPDVPTAAEEETVIPLSVAGKKLQNLVRRPLAERNPVGYQREWLDTYEPGKTWYLPEKTRRRLLEIGKTLESERPAGTYARDILGRLLIDLSWASSRLEGNTYTRLDTQNLLEFGQRAEGKDTQEAQMILNHKAAIEYLVADIENIRFDRHTIQALHALLSDNLLGNPRDEGRLRTHAVNITGTKYTPTAIPQLIEECFDRIVRVVSAIPDPFEQAFFLMVHLPYLQPFADVNKRTSRLAANISLVKANLAPLSFIDLSERAYTEGTIAVYEHRRVELLADVFAWAYERSAAQYRVIRDSLPPPNPIRLRYRNELTQCISETVRSGAAPRTELMLACANTHGVATSDQTAFAETALEILLNLNEGSAARYLVTPSEFRSWRDRFSAPVTRSNEGS